MGFQDSFMGVSGRTKIGEVTVDASVAEVHNIDAKITDHPVEVGSDISDNYRKTPQIIKIDGWITDTPIATGYPAQTAIDSVRNRNAAASPTGAAWATINKYFEEATIITVETSLKKYKNVLLTGFSVTRNSGAGSTLKFSCTGREIRLVFTAEGAAITIPRKKTAQKKSQDKGKGGTGDAAGDQEISKGKKPTQDANKEQSLWHKAQQALGL